MNNPDNFPNDTARRMMDMVSPIYDNSYVGKWIFLVMGVDMGKAKETIFGLADEVFPGTASWTLPYWESAYGLESNESLSDDERRLRILEKRNKHYPMNPERLAALLKTRFERDFEVIEKSGTYTFLIKINQGKAGIDFAKLFEFVDGLKPSHMGYSAILNLREKIKISAGFAVKEYKKIGVTEYTATDPTVGIDCYADEIMNMLADENGDLLVV